MPSGSEEKQRPLCPACGMSMRFARVIATLGLADLQSFQCDLCGVVLSGEAVVEAAEVVPAASPVSARRSEYAQGYDRARAQELVERMATLRSRWLASVNDAVAGRTPAERLTHRLTQSKDWARTYRGSASPAETPPGTGSESKK